MGFIKQIKVIINTKNMKKYHFRYRVNNQDLHVLITGESMNDAMIFFAENYHEIQYIYGVFELPI